MRKTVLSCIAVLMCYCSSAQNSFPTPNGNVTIGTSNSTYSLNMGSSTTGIAQYNTVDGASNYEIAKMGWNNNIYEIATQRGGTGDLRALSLGIGTTSLARSITISNIPSSRLGIIKHDFGTISSINSAGVGIIGTLSSSNGAQFGQSILPTVNQSGSGSYRALWISAYEQATGSGNKFLIDAGTNASGPESGTHTSKFTVNSNGIGYFASNLGIGTTAPAGLIEAVGGASATKTDMLYLRSNFTTNGTSTGLRFINSTLAANTTSGGQISVKRTSTGGDMYFSPSDETGFVDRVVIKSNGSVGVGTSNPQARLQVRGTGTSLNSYETIADEGMAVQAATGSRSATNGAQLEFVIPADVDGGNFWGQARIITVAANATNGNASGKMILGTRRYFNKAGTGSQWYYGNDLTIDGGGNVGIGTITPDEKLAVNGTIHSKEVKVDLNVAGPDYVFDSDYNLQPLNDLKAFLDKNHHLPEIPSAVQMEKEGINLSDMNMKLLKKVEELTLYIIDQNKMILDQQQKLISQQSINSSLQQQINDLSKLVK